MNIGCRTHMPHPTSQIPCQRIDYMPFTFFSISTDRELKCCFSVGVHVPLIRCFPKPHPAPVWIRTVLSKLVICTMQKKKKLDNDTAPAGIGTDRHGRTHIHISNNSGKCIFSVTIENQLHPDKQHATTIIGIIHRLCYAAHQSAIFSKVHNTHPRIQI